MHKFNKGFYICIWIVSRRTLDEMSWRNIKFDEKWQKISIFVELIICKLSWSRNRGGLLGNSLFVWNVGVEGDETRH